MDNLPIHRRNFKILEKQCLDLCSIVVIDDKSLDQPNATYSALIYGIVPLIESLAKDLHKELSPQFPDFLQFKPNENFDYKALAFLDKALGLSQKQVTVTSDLVAISDANRVLTPLLGAHEKNPAKHPLWSRAYQDYKHDQANTQNQCSANIPTARSLLEAIGAAFLLLAVARSLPIDIPKPFIKFDFTFGSELFAATYNRVFFTRFISPLGTDCLQLASDWTKHLFVVKDPEQYIKNLKAAEEQENRRLLTKALDENPTFKDFYNSLSTQSTDFAKIVQLYGEKSIDPAQKEWSHKQILLKFPHYTRYISAWANGEHYLLSRFGFDPLVALNYKKAEELYDYAKLNQDENEPDANQQSQQS